MKNKKTDKKNIAVILGLSFTIVLSLVAASYAIFTFSKPGEKENEVVTGTLRLVLDEGLSGNAIDIDPAIPVSQSVGLSQEPYTFALRNTGTSPATYRLSLIDYDRQYDRDGCERIPKDKIMVSFTKDGEPLITDSLSNIEYFDTGDILPTGAEEAGITYTMKIWIDESAGNEIMGAHFHGQLMLEGIVQGHTNFETGE